MVFQDTDHEQNFGLFVEKTECGYGEPDYMAALFLLSTPLLARRTMNHVKRRAIEFPKLLELIKPWSSSEKALVRLAASLFNGSYKADVNDTFWNLDAANINLVLKALEIRFGSKTRNFPV